VGVAAALILAGATGARADTDRLVVKAERYDQEYPSINYSGPATHNRVWRLQQRMNAGDVQLAWEPKWGYLRSLLTALEINLDSQVMVFSKTSLQEDQISEKTPRAIYFNEDTYVGYVPGTSQLEVTAVDARVGAVFFVVLNRRDDKATMERAGGRCLSCHDTYSMMGGGVPRVLAMSSPVDDLADTRAFSSATDVDDRTPIAERWGGWYVTGRHGSQTHFGNMPLRLEERSRGDLLRSLPRADRLTLAGYFDTTAYFTDKSDIAALLVLEHQSFVQNLITRTQYKLHKVMASERRESQPIPQLWADLSPPAQGRIKVLTEPLVRALFMADATRFQDRLESSSGFAARFAKSGPHDAQGRSLRELDLKTQLFRYPLSFQIYTEAFDALPPYVLDYIDIRVAEVLSGRDKTGISARISATDRQVIAGILAETKPRFAPER
jgi:hypothetical protein